MVKIHTDLNVADILTKGFDAGRFQYLVSREAHCVYKQSRIDRRTCYIKQKCVNSRSSRKFKRGRDIRIPQSGGPPKKVGDETVYKELGDRMERAATTASSLEAEQDSVSRQYLVSTARHILILLGKVNTAGLKKIAAASTLEEGKMKITATIDRRIKTITEASIRRHLKLEDSDGITTLPNAKIFEQLALMGVEKLEHKVKTSQHRRRARVVLSDDEEDLEDPSKQGRKIAKIDENPLFHWDAEIAKQLQEAIAKADSAHDIDWNDPAEGYKQSHFKGIIYEDIRFIFERVWDQIHAFVPMDSEIEKEVMKKSGFVLQQKKFVEEVSEKKDDSGSKPVGGSIKKIVAKKKIGAKLDEESAKRQKLKHVTEEEATTESEKEKEELRLSLKIIHNDDSEVNYEPLSKKFPIVSWKYQLLEKMEAKDMKVCKLTRADGSSSYHENIQAFLRRLDRQDLNDLYSLVQERVHTLFMDGALMEINMLVEMKYPLIKKLLEKMLNLQLEAEEESTMTFKLIKFIKSLLEEHKFQAIDLYLSSSVEVLLDCYQGHVLSFTHKITKVRLGFMTLNLDDMLEAGHGGRWWCHDHEINLKVTYTFALWICAKVSVSVLVMDEGTIKSVSQLPKERLLMVLARDVCVDVRKVGEYRRMSRELRESVRRLSACISELRLLGDCGDGYETVRLFKRLGLKNMEKGIRLCLMMKETHVKIIEKGNFIMKLRDGGVV
uniref:Uncharacterized protein n=1 Tax=Tanacetum cinerariifolium TaxID=118510 RepID=A0A6L2NRT6_TANCI|nr:hypothetical protein [Tanacetum cinerariifolium]